MLVMFRRMSSVAVKALIAFVILFHPLDAWVSADPAGRPQMRHLAAGYPVRIERVLGSGTNIGTFLQCTNLSNMDVSVYLARGDALDTGAENQRMMVAEIMHEGSRGGSLQAADDVPFQVEWPGYEVSKRVYVFRFGPHETKLIRLNTLCLDLKREPLDFAGVAGSAVTFFRVDTPAVKRLFAEVDRKNKHLAATKNVVAFEPNPEWTPVTAGKPAIRPDVYNIAIWRLQGATLEDIKAEFPFGDRDAMSVGWNLGGSAEEP
jgi:hypothetical protein